MPEYEARGKKFKLPLSENERKRRTLQNQKERGDHQLTVRVDADTWAILDELLDRFPREKKQSLISRLIHEAHEAHCKT